MVAFFRGSTSSVFLAHNSDNFVIEGKVTLLVKREGVALDDPLSSHLPPSRCAIARGQRQTPF